MIRISEAFEIIDREPALNVEEAVPLGDVVGRVLAEDIVADTDLPPFDRSQMDGFAVRSKDTEIAPVELRVVGESAAGRGWHDEIKSGEAVLIMTGAPVPAGADAVQKLELTEESGVSFHCSLKQDETCETVRVLESVEMGKFIVRRGAEVKKTDRVFSAGEIVTPQMIASLATFGYSEVKVARRPKIAILATGSEIVSVGETPGNDQIRNSNSPMLAAIACKFGDAQQFPLVADNINALSRTIAEAAYKNDMLVITGGVSVGKYDLTKAALQSLGAEIFFERVKLKPGKPTVFARLGDTLVFGLPGNPVSAAVTFHLFVTRAMLKMQGANDFALAPGFAVAARKVKGAAERDTFLPGVIQSDERGRTIATPLKWIGSSDFIGFAKAEVLIFVPAGKTFDEGEVVQTFRI